MSNFKVLLLHYVNYVQNINEYRLLLRSLTKCWEATCDEHEVVGKVALLLAASYRGHTRPATTQLEF